MTETTICQLGLYVVQRHNGMYKTKASWNSNWTEDLQEAHIYTNLSAARACVTTFTDKDLMRLAPKILRLRIVATEPLDETKRVRKAVLTREIAKARRELRRYQPATRRHAPQEYVNRRWVRLTTEQIADRAAATILQIGELMQQRAAV